MSQPPAKISKRKCTGWRNPPHDEKLNGPVKKRKATRAEMAEMRARAEAREAAGYIPWQPTESMYQAVNRKTKGAGQ